MKLKQTYQAMQAELNPTERLIRRTVAAAHPEKKRPVYRVRTAALIAAVLALVLVISLPVMASTDTGYNLLYSISPETAQFFRPVDLSDENEGIKMTVESVYIHEDPAEIYISLQDLTGNRMDETISLQNNYTLNLSFGGMVQTRTQFLRHDPDSNTNHYLLTMQEVNSDALQNAPKTTFTLGQILLGEYTVDNADCGFDLTAINMDPKTMDMAHINWSGSVPSEELKEKIKTHFTGQNGYETLVPAASLCSITPNIDITAAGYKNGMLRLQVCYSGVLARESHGNLYLTHKSESDTYRYSEMVVSYYNENNTKRYEEFLFDIAQEELQNYSLSAHFTPYTDVIEGSWQVTFPLKETN